MTYVPYIYFNNEICCLFCVPCVHRRHGKIMINYNQQIHILSALYYTCLHMNGNWYDTCVIYILTHAHTTLYLSFSLFSLFLSFSLSLFLSFSLSLFISLSLSLFLSYYLTIFLSLSLSVFLSSYLSLFLSFSLSIFLSFSLSLFLSFYLSIFLSFCLFLFLLHTYTHNHL